MLAAEPAPRGAQHCQFCEYRDPHGSVRGSTCQHTGQYVRSFDSCEHVTLGAFYQRHIAAVRVREEQLRTGSRPARAYRRAEPAVAVAAPPVQIIPQNCGHCGSPMIYPDPDGFACAMCGWHDWRNGHERVFGEQVVGDGMHGLVKIAAEGY